jgi:hypothetical protein
MWQIYCENASVHDNESGAGYQISRLCCVVLFSGLYTYCRRGMGIPVALVPRKFVHECYVVWWIMEN